MASCQSQESGPGHGEEELIKVWAFWGDALPAYGSCPLGPWKGSPFLQHSERTEVLLT